MGHPSQRRFVQLVAEFMPQFCRGVRVLEVGALNVNGSVRDFFQDCDYVGIDIAAGPDVDVVCEGQHYLSERSFDHVISCEVMEHNPHWRETFRNMLARCRPGGLITMSCATTGRAEHGTLQASPADSPLTVAAGSAYYRNLVPRDVERAAALRGVLVDYRLWRNWSSFDLYFLGLRAGSAETTASGWSQLVAAVDRFVAAENVRKVCRFRALLARLGGDHAFRTLRHWLGRPRYLLDG